jgi:hypothetical protein
LIHRALIVLVEAIVLKRKPFDSTFQQEQNTAHVYACEVKDNLQNAAKARMAISSSRSKCSHILGLNETDRI